MRTGVLGELRDGFDAVRERVWVWATVAAFSVTLLAGMAPLLTLGATIADEAYGDTAVYGIMQAFFGGGTLTGALIAARSRPARPMRAAMLGALVWPLAFGAFALGVPEPVLYMVTVASGIGVGLFGVWWETALAERIPPQLLSRVSSFDWMGSLALLPLGFLLAGPAAEAFGAVEVLIVGGLAATLVQIAGLVTPGVWRLQNSPRPSSGVEASA